MKNILFKAQREISNGFDFFRLSQSYRGLKEYIPYICYRTRFLAISALARCNEIKCTSFTEAWDYISRYPTLSEKEDMIEFREVHDLYHQIQDTYEIPYSSLSDNNLYRLLCHTRDWLQKVENIVKG